MNVCVYVRTYNVNVNELKLFKTKIKPSTVCVYYVCMCVNSVLCELCNVCELCICVCVCVCVYMWMNICVFVCDCLCVCVNNSFFLIFFCLFIKIRRSDTAFFWEERDIMAYTKSQWIVQVRSSNVMWQVLNVMWQEFACCGCGCFEFMFVSPFF